MDAELALTKAKRAAEHAWELMSAVELANSEQQAHLLIQTSLGWSGVAQTMLALYDITPDSRTDVLDAAMLRDFVPLTKRHPSTRNLADSGGTVINIHSGMRGVSPTHIVVDEINDGWAADDPDDGA